MSRQKNYITDSMVQRRMVPQIYSLCVQISVVCFAGVYSVLLCNSDISFLRVSDSVISKNVSITVKQ